MLIIITIPPGVDLEEFILNHVLMDIHVDDFNIIGRQIDIYGHKGVVRRILERNRWVVDFATFDASKPEQVSYCEWWVDAMNTDFKARPIEKLKPFNAFLQRLGYELDVS